MIKLIKFQIEFFTHFCFYYFFKGWFTLDFCDLDGTFVLFSPKLDFGLFDLDLLSSFPFIETFAFFFFFSLDTLLAGDNSFGFGGDFKPT